MKIKIINVRPNAQKKRDYFVDFLFEGWGVIIKGARIRFLQKGDMRCDLPYLQFNKEPAVKGGKPIKTKYSPVCFETPEQRNLCKKLVCDEFVRQAVSYKETKNVAV